MKLEKIHIKNFQCHIDLIIEFNSGVNVIYGDTGTGKSAFFKALAFLFNNLDDSENDYRREGTKETSVKGWFDSGFVVERIRSNSINRYILTKDGCEDKVFDTFGRNTPEEIQKVFQISPITIETESINLNFASQDQLNFILGKNYSDSFKAKLFNKLTGNELLDVLFKSCNKEKSQVNKKIETLETSLEKQEADLSEYTTKYQKLKKKCNLVKTKFCAIQEDIEIYNYLSELAESLKENTVKKEEVRTKLKTIKTVSQETINSLKEEANHLTVLNDLFVELKAVDDNLKRIKEKKATIKDVKVDFNKLKEENEKIKILTNLNEALNDNTEILQTATIDMKALNDILKKNDKKLKELWATQKVCPLCKRSLKNE